MKRTFKLFAILCIAYFALNTTINASVEKEKVSLEVENKLLWDYYYASENLLDTLEMKYNWVDAIDNYDYYDAVEALYDNNLLIE